MAEDRKTVHVPVVVDNNAMPVATAPLRAVAAGQIKIGNIVIDCYVLSDEKRVVTRRTLLGAITSKGAEIKGAAGMGDLGRYLKRLPSRFAHLASRPGIEFVTTSGARAIGHTVAEFGDICDAYVSGALAGELKSSQMPIAVQCHTLADQSGSKSEFWQRLGRHYKGTAIQLLLTGPVDKVRPAKAPKPEPTEA